MKRITAALILLLAAGAAGAQQTDKDKEQEKDRQKPPPAKVYTNDDLKHHSSSPPAPKGAPAAPPASTSTRPTDPRSPEEIAWHTRAQRAREVVRAAERDAAEAQRKVNGLVVDANPMERTSDPYRQQSLEAQRAKAADDLKKAQAALDAANKAWEALQEEARRANVPPGWLRD